MHRDYVISGRATQHTSIAVLNNNEWGKFIVFHGDVYSKPFFIYRNKTEGPGFLTNDRGMFDSCAILG